MVKFRRQAAEPEPVTRSFALADVIAQYRQLVAEEQTDFVHDTLVIGGGAAGAGVLRDLASRGNASAILVDRGPFGGETSSKTGKAIHPGIRYLRMAFHRLLLAAKLRRDPKIKQSTAQNLRGAWLDLQLVWYGTRERKILIETSRNTVEEIPNVVFVLPDSPEKKWAVFFGISLYDMFTTLWAWCGLQPRFSGVKLFRNRNALHRRLPHVNTREAVGGILYWDGKANNDKVLVVKAIRDAYYRGSDRYPIRALSQVELTRYDWVAAGHFEVTLTRRFAHDELPATVTIRAYTIANAAGPWIDQARNRTTHTDGRTSVVYSRGTHLEATNEFIHRSLAADPRLQVGLVPLNPERQHYLRPFLLNGIWYVQCTTTDRAHRDPDLVVPAEDEIEELLASYNELVAADWQLGRRDIFHVFCGLRPLAADDGGEIAVQDISRMFRIGERPVGDGVVYDLINVKLTEFRWAGQEVADLVADRLRRITGKRLGRSATARLPFLPVADEERFALDRPDHPRQDPEFLRAKVAHYVRYQLAADYRDYLMNNGGIRDAVVFDEHGRCLLDLAALELVLAEFADLLGWDRAECRVQWDAFRASYLRNMAFAEIAEPLRDHRPAVLGEDLEPVPAAP